MWNGDESRTYRHFDYNIIYLKQMHHPQNPTDQTMYGKPKDLRGESFKANDKDCIERRN
jgi:hypothetical protein